MAPGGDQSGRSVDVHADAYDDLLEVASGKRAKEAATAVTTAAAAAATTARL
eukprot:COSAG01_NODE_5590_length_4160_cov_1.695395_2_plen_52_part_00